MHLRTRKLSSSSECSIKVPCISSAVLAGQVPWELLSSLWTAPWLWSVPQHMETWKEANQGQQLIVNLPLGFQRPGSPSKTEGAGLGGCYFDATFVTNETLKAVAEMSHCPDLSYVRQAPLRSVRLWVSHLIYLLSCLSGGLSAKDWAAELTRKLQQLKLSLRSGQGNPPCLTSKGECEGNVWVVGQCVRTLALGVFCFSFWAKNISPSAWSEFTPFEICF